MVSAGVKKTWKEDTASGSQQSLSPVLIITPSVTIPGLTRYCSK